MAQPLDDAKKSLRAAMRTRRRALDPASQTAASNALVAHLGRIFPPAPGGDLLGTCAHGGEINPGDYLAQWCLAGGRLLLPRVIGLALMEWRHAANPRHCVAGFRGIPEPDPARCAMARPAPGALILVPGLAFDLAGRRLGQGGGFYDRLLAEPPPGAVSVGICHDFQIVDAVPIDPANDKPVDWVVSPRSAHRCGGST